MTGKRRNIVNRGFFFLHHFITNKPLKIKMVFPQIPRMLSVEKKRLKMSVTIASIFPVAPWPRPEYHLNSTEIFLTTVNENPSFKDAKGI